MSEKKVKHELELKKNTTSIDDIFKSSSNQTISFLDEAHSLHLYNITTSLKKNNNSKYHCYWDHHPFDSYPVFCPINYNSTKLEKNYFSYISKNSYKIRENIVNEDSNELKNDSLTIIQTPEYITDGIFCSFNCAQAFIDENKTNPLYNLSSVLLLKLYNQIYPSKQINMIIGAPHWRLLDVYGGPKTITEFRNAFNTIEYKYGGHIFHNSISHLYEEKLRLN
jgi:hypothetical protein